VLRVLLWVLAVPLIVAVAVFGWPFVALAAVTAGPLFFIVAVIRAAIREFRDPRPDRSSYVAGRFGIDHLRERRQRNWKLHSRQTVERD
jgi:hypothetical protein